MVTKEGIPLGYELFEGNRHDSTTVEEIIEKMEALYGKSDRVWIMDRGMASPDNLELLQEEGRRYILGTPRGQLKRFEKELLTQDWKQVHEGLEVKLCSAPPDGNEHEIFILCRSASRREKEQAIHDRFVERLCSRAQALRIGPPLRRVPLEAAIDGEREIVRDLWSRRSERFRVARQPLGQRIQWTVAVERPMT